MRSPPAFQLYASDMLASESVRLMRLDERGLLFTLYCTAWVNGSIPADHNAMARLLGITDTELQQSFTPRVQSFFSTSSVDAGRLLSPELEGQRRELEQRRLERSASGKKGAESLHGKARRSSGSA